MFDSDITPFLQGAPTTSQHVVLPSRDYRTEHFFSRVEDGKTRAALRLGSNASASTNMPVYTDGDSVSGVLEVDTKYIEKFRTVDAHVSLERPCHWPCRLKCLY
jgi:hypothetical protein